MYRGRLARDFERWVKMGLLEAPVAERLLQEYDGRRSSFSIGSVLMALAAVLMSASILLLVAAGWEDIPRLMKIGGILALIWIFHLSAAFASWQQAPRLAGALLILGCASFGGGIALVGQLYHVSGDAVDAMLVWLSVTLLSAALFRSAALTGAAGLLTWALFLYYLDDHNFEWVGLYPWTVIAGAVATLALVWWTQAGRVRHLVYTLALAFLIWIYFLYESPTVAILYLVLGTAFFAVLSQRVVPLPSFIDQSGAAPAFYALVLAVIGLGILHMVYDTAAGRAILAAVTVGLTVLVLALAGRDNGAARYLAYLVFSVEVLYLSFVTIDSMLGTSGFFLISGVVVAMLAFVVIRLEKLLAARAASREAP
ncbi:DUF2157 domain-containing protein [Ciceribacter sp. L1K23]|uniref:DUF2157 domain-containing protein n=1 Tax=Ciceribacter sp. L1K23 TaxID=2820276 RepID=UPI001B83E3E6|nr:DUF2157 domain-containing protein [Ciceribacter sp. L1K23]MBR0555791.1 DUF2157 domain-containing protein [Ciceribacter sp. L1K23]